MKITIEHYDNKYTIEKDHDDVLFDEYMDMLKKMTSFVYTEELWNNYFEEKDEN